MDMEKLQAQLQGNADLRQAMNSPAGQALAARLDGTALNDAAKRGDTAALKDILGRVLATPEGKALAAQVQKAVGKK